MAQAADHGDKSTAKVAESRELHQREKHSGDSQRANKRRNVTAEEKERIRELYQAPVVRTILLPGMEKHVIGKRRGWNWEKS